MKLTSPPGQTPRARTRVPRCCQPRGTFVPSYRHHGPADVGPLVGAPGAEQEHCPNRLESPRPGRPRPRTTAASTRRPVAPSPTAQKAENAAHVLELDGAIGGVRPRAPRNAPARAAAAAPDADLGSEELAKCPVRVRRRLDTSPAQSRRRRGRERPSRAGAAPPPPTGPSVAAARASLAQAGQTDSRLSRSRHRSRCQFEFRGRPCQPVLLLCLGLVDFPWRRRRGLGGSSLALLAPSRSASSGAAAAPPRETAAPASRQLSRAKSLPWSSELARPRGGAIAAGELARAARAVGPRRDLFALEEQGANRRASSPCPSRPAPSEGRGR